MANLVYIIKQIDGLIEHYDHAAKLSTQHDEVYKEFTFVLKEIRKALGGE